MITRSAQLGSRSREASGAHLHAHRTLVSTALRTSPRTPPSTHCTAHIAQRTRHSAQRTAHKHQHHMRHHHNHCHHLMHLQLAGGARGWCPASVGRLVVIASPQLCHIYACTAASSTASPPRPHRSSQKSGEHAAQLASHMPAPASACAHHSTARENVLPALTSGQHSSFRARCQRPHMQVRALRLTPATNPHTGAPAPRRL